MSGKNIQAYSLFVVYGINFVIFLCVTLKLFSVGFVALLAPNPIATPLNAYENQAKT